MKTYKEKLISTFENDIFNEEKCKLIYDLLNYLSDIYEFPSHNDIMSKIYDGKAYDVAKPQNLYDDLCNDSFIDQTVYSPTVYVYEKNKEYISNFKAAYIDFLSEKLSDI